MENKICKNCWYYIPVPITNKFLDDSVSLKDFPYCEFDDDFHMVKPGDTCENWKSHRENLIRIAGEVGDEIEREKKKKIYSTSKSRK